MLDDATAVIPGVADDPGTGTTTEVEVTDEGIVSDGEVVVEEIPAGDADPAKSGEEADPAAGKAKEVVEEEDPTLFERDGRKVDDKTRKVIAELKKTNPVAAKALADKHFHLTAYEREFPSVQAAREGRALIESLGGQEGIGKLQEEVTDYRTEIDQFARGDKGLIETLYQSNPEALVTSAQNSLDVLREKDHKAFQLAMLPSFVEALDGAQYPQFLTAAMQAVYDGKGQEAWNALEKMKDWYDKVKGALTKHRDTRSRVDPERQRLNADRQKFDQEKVKARDDQASSDVNVANNRVLARTVDLFFDELKLKVGGRKAFVNELQSRVWSAMSEDQAFKATAKRIKDTGDMTRYVEYVSAKFADLLPDHFEATRNDLYPTYKPTRRTDPPKPGAATNGKKPAAPGAKPAALAGAAPAWVQVSQAPKPQEVDYDKTTDIMMIKGFYILKGGKRLKVV